MLGLGAIGATALGASGSTGATPAPPPANYNAHVAQFAAVAVTSEHVPGYASQMAIVVPSADLAIPTAGAQMAQIAFVAVTREYTLIPQTHGYTIRQLWGFPLLIQTGV